MTRREPGPDFVVIGAMKCGTSSLHDQLAAQDGVFMTTPKEPNFFSDDEIFRRGTRWYSELFEAAPPASLRGESSTHYTKLPTHPETVPRIRSLFPSLKLIYVVRHPIDRLVSHYIHEWTQRVIDTSLERALDLHPELVAYSEYGRQLAPWREAYGDHSICVVLTERLRRQPQEELRRVADFLGLRAGVRWRDDLAPSNVSAERLRASPIRDALVEQPVLRTLRRTLFPKRLRTWIRGFWQMRDRPTLSPHRVAALETHFDEDLARLENLLERPLTCARFREESRRDG